MWRRSTGSRLKINCEFRLRDRGAYNQFLQLNAEKHKYWKDNLRRKIGALIWHDSQFCLSITNQINRDMDCERLRDWAGACSLLTAERLSPWVTTKLSSLRRRRYWKHDHHIRTGATRTTITEFKT
jgi:hypothetical protein